MFHAKTVFLMWVTSPCFKKVFSSIHCLLNVSVAPFLVLVMPLGKVSVTASECCNLSYEKKCILKIEELEIKQKCTSVSFLLTLHAHFLVDALMQFNIN